MTYQGILSPPVGVSQGSTDSPCSNNNYWKSILSPFGYQNILSPPVGVSQGDASHSNYKNHDKGKSIVDAPYGFLWFYIPNGIAFFIAWFITLAMLGVVAKSIMYFMYPLYLLMCVCFVAAMVMIAPSGMLASVGFGAGSIIVILIYYTCLFLFPK